jgi:hypothetical protein
MSICSGHTSVLQYLNACSGWDPFQFVQQPWPFDRIFLWLIWYCWTHLLHILTQYSVPSLATRYDFIMSVECAPLLRHKWTDKAGRCVTNLVHLYFRQVLLTWITALETNNRACFDMPLPLDYNSNCCKETVLNLVFRFQGMFYKYGHRKHHNLKL